MNCVKVWVGIFDRKDFKLARTVAQIVCKTGDLRIVLPRHIWSLLVEQVEIIELGGQVVRWRSVNVRIPKSSPRISATPTLDMMHEHFTHTRVRHKLEVCSSSPAHFNFNHVIEIHKEFHWKINIFVLCLFLYHIFLFQMFCTFEIICKIDNLLKGTFASFRMSKTFSTHFEIKNFFLGLCSHHKS